MVGKKLDGQVFWKRKKVINLTAAAAAVESKMLIIIMCTIDTWLTDHQETASGLVKST